MQSLYPKNLWINKPYSFNFYNDCIDNVMDYKKTYNTLGVESDLKLGKIKTLKKEVYKVIVQCLMRYWYPYIFNDIF